MPTPFSQQPSSSPPPLVTTPDTLSTSGFHDIKPLPAFHPLPIWPLELLAMLLLVSAFYWWRRKHPKVIPIAPPLRPYITAINAIELLASKQKSLDIAVCDLAAALSLAVRNYLEQSGFCPAVEQTRHELIASLKTRLSSISPNQDQSKKRLATEIIEIAKPFFRFSEKATFVENPEEIYPLCSAEVNESIDQARRIVFLVEELLRPMPALQATSSTATDLTKEACESDQTPSRREQS